MLGFAEALRLETTTENRGRIVRRFPEFPRLVEEILPGGVIRAARFDGRRAFLAVETSDGVIHVQDSESGEVSGPIRFPGGQPRLLAVSGDGRTLVAVSVAGELCVARLPDGVMVVHDLASSAPVGSIAVDRTGASICIRHVDSACRYWTLSGHRLEPAMSTRDEAAEWSGSDRWSVQPHEDGGIRVIDSINGEVLWTITPAGRFARFAVSPAADHVVAADEEGRLQFWTGQFQVADARLPRRFGAATAIRFDATGRYPVAANDRGQFQLFDSKSGIAVTPVVSHDGPLVAVRYDSESRELMAISATSGVRVWGLSGRPSDRTRYATVDPAACPAEEMLAWLQFVSGVRLGESGELTALSTGELAALRGRFNQAAAGKSLPGRGD
jgi:WD40 repeat protein